MKYVLAHVNVFDGLADSKLMEDMHIYVDGDVICDIVSGSQELKAGYREIDVKGRYVMPGLINLHAHLFGSGKPSKMLGGGGLQKPVLKFCATSLGSKVLHKIVQENVKNELFSGVTTLRSVGDFYYSDVYVRNKIEAGEAIGPRLLVSGPAITVPGGHGDGTFAITASEPEELKKLVQRNHKQKVDLIKICVTGGVMDAKKKGEPGELKMNLEQTMAVCREAHRLGYLVASHTESPQGIDVALSGGVDTIEHGSLLNEETIQLFKDQRSSLICTLSPALPLANFSAQRTKLNELCVYNSRVVLDHMIEGVKQALDRDIPVGLGTDASCPYVTQYNMWREVYYFAKYIGVSNAFALHTATLKNAQIIGIDDITGSIEVGKSADMIVMDTNPLENLRALETLHSVMVKGKLYEHPVVKKHEQIEKELDELL